ncbi:MAG: hypothetical protein MUO30_07935 [Anaerolineales bacterium]|nr:hypothetical protein [Anaerolineales bacterium]
MRFERRGHIEIRARDDDLDRLQAEAQLAVEQDLLEFQQRLVAILTIAISAT